MRLLTLGVLICAGGTLAALPFRLSPSKREGIDKPARATGPIVADAMDTQLGKQPAAIQQNVVGGGLLVQQVDLHSAMEAQEAASAVAYQLPTPAIERSVFDHLNVKPLTYEDLAVPVVPPQMVQQRYGAIAKDDPVETTSEPQTRVKQADRGEANLASSVLRSDQLPMSESIPSLPESVKPIAKRPARTKHWIRQP